MAEQLDHLAEITHWPKVRLGVIPWTAAATVFPVSGFHIFDNRAVMAASDAATSFYTDAQDVIAYEKLWAELEALVAFGAGAREHISRIAAEYWTLRD
jgi:hypothetical protein